MGTSIINIQRDSRPTLLMPLATALTDPETSLVILNTIRNAGGRDVSSTPPIDPSTAETDGSVSFTVESPGS